MSKYKFIKEDGEKILVHDEEKIKVLIDEPALKKKVKELGTDGVRATQSQLNDG